MTLFKYDPRYQDPFASIDSLLEQFGRGFRNTLSEASSARRFPVNFYETDSAYELRAELPGVEKSDVNVELENAVLQIKAHRKIGSGQEDEREVTLVRTVTVGDDVDPDNIKARLENGILSIHLAKREAKQPKTIKVN